MSWGKLDDRLWSNPKVEELGARPHGDAALGSWVRALSRSFDIGRPTLSVDAWMRATGKDKRTSKKRIAALAAVGLVTFDGTHVTFHDWAEYAHPDAVKRARSAAPSPPEAAGEAAHQAAGERADQVAHQAAGDVAVKVAGEGAHQVAGEGARKHPKKPANPSRDARAQFPEPEPEPEPDPREGESDLARESRARAAAGDALEPPPWGVLLSEFAGVVHEVTGHRVAAPEGPRAIAKAKTAVGAMSRAEVLDDLVAFAGQLGDPARWPSWPFGRYCDHAGRWQARAAAATSSKGESGPSPAKRILAALRDAERVIGNGRQLPELGVFTPFANQTELLEQVESIPGQLKSEAETFVELVLDHEMHIEHERGIVHDFVDGMRGLGWGDVLEERRQELRKAAEARAPGLDELARRSGIGDMPESVRRAGESERSRASRVHDERQRQRQALASAVLGGAQ